MALNEMGGRGQRRLAAAGAELHNEALQHLRGVYASVPACPPEVTARRAVSAVLGSDSGYVDDVALPGKHATYRRGDVSYPPAAQDAVDLAGRLPVGPRSVLLGETGSLLIDPSLQQHFAGKLAFDQKLATNAQSYAAFLGDLFARDLVEVGVSTHEVTPFFVRKKDGKLRLIFDTRSANLAFSPPDFVALAGPQALGAIELGPDERLFIRQGDVTCCFYQFLLPASLRGFFGLRPVPWRSLPQAMRERLGPEPADGMVRFRLRVVPMGWSWAVFFVQEAMLHILRSAVGDFQVLAQNRPAAPLGPGGGASVV